MVGASIDIGQVVRKAVVFNPKYATEHPVNESSLLQSVEQLFELLDERRIDYVLVDRPDLARLFTLLAKHLNAADLSALQEIVVEIEQRIDRFNKGLLIVSRAILTVI